MRRFTLFMATLLTAVVAVAQENEPAGEYAYKEMASREGDTLQVEPLVVTPSSMSKMEVIYRIQTDLRICEGDLIEGVTFKGYNPGQEQVRHLTVWLKNDNSIGLPNDFFSTDKMTKVFDGDCKILSGGTKDKPEDILHIAFDTPLSYLNGYNLRMVIMSQGVASGDSVLFLQSRGITAASVYATTGQNGQLGEPSRSVMPFAVFTIATPVKYVSGTVTDEDAKGVAGATVKLRGMQWEETIYEGVTDSEGKYRIRIEEGNKTYAPSATAPGHTCFSNVSDFSVKENPTKDFTLYGSVTYPANQQSSIILPVAPDATVGRYYRLARREGKKFIFERERSPQANVPYVLFADRDYKVDLSGMDLTITPGRTKADDMLSLVGSYRNGDNEYANYIDRDLDTHSNTGRAMHAHLYGHYSLLLDDDYELVFVDSDTIAGNEYKPIVEDGKVWTYHYYNAFTGKEFYESLTVSGDTIINNKSYKKIVDVTTGRVDCAIREEGRKVYATYPHYSGEKLIYDFGLNVGDAFQLYDDNNGSDPNAWATVVSVDTIVVGSRAFRALDVRSNDMKGWPNWWVEGIGGKYGLTVNCLLPGNSYCFSSCKLGEDTLFTNHDFQTLGTIPSIETQMAYYYYKGDKVPLTLNENKVIVSIPKEYDEISKRIRANIPVLRTIKDDIFDSFIIPGPDFEKLTSKDFWEEDAKSVILTSSYYTQDNEEVFETPYLNVKLKKEEDASLLASYAERYRLKIVGNSSYMPLWYILHVTLDSEKSPLQCANEIFESGEFASAVPDLSSDDDFDLGIAYRPFIEDGKVWKVGTIPTVLGNPVQVVDYYYFDGDTIIGGKTCKQMMCQRYVGSDFSDAKPNLSYVGAWYEEDKKVYFYDEKRQSMTLKYDFSLDDNESLQLIDDYPPFIIGPKQTGGLEGFKGVYRDVMISENIRSTTWLEGVGGLDGPTRNAYAEAVDRMPEFLMSCTVGDEVIYFNDEYEDGATPDAARKQRIDFTHTIKTKPKSRMMREEAEASLYGEYNDQQLGINLDPLDDSYLVQITDESGKAVYEKAVNAGNIVGLNIDISDYAEGRYTVTVENNDESFTGQFDAQTTSISLTPALSHREGAIYNLQGQRLSSLRKGLNIVNGRKVFVK